MVPMIPYVPYDTSGEGILNPRINLDIHALRGNDNIARRLSVRDAKQMHLENRVRDASKEKAHRLGRKRKRMLELANRVAELIPHMAAVSDPEHESVFDTGIKLLSDFNHHVGAFLKLRLMNKDVESSTFKSKKTLHMPGMRLDQPSKDLKCHSTAFTRNKKPGRKRRKLSSRGTIEEQDRVGEQLELCGL